MSGRTLFSRIGALFGSNRREFARRPVATPVTLDVSGERHGCHVRDVSPTGAFIVPALPLPLGTLATIEVAAGLSAEVRVVRKTSEGLGLEFLRAGAGAIVAGWTQGRSA